MYGWMMVLYEELRIYLLEYLYFAGVVYLGFLQVVHDLPSFLLRFAPNWLNRIGKLTKKIFQIQDLKIESILVIMNKH